MTVGKFIVVEGLDNVGKTTFVKHFLEKNPLVISRKFPSKHTVDVINSMNYDNINWKVIHSVFHNDLQDSMPQIQMMLAEGTSIICDRYVYSHFVYEKLRGNDIPCTFFPFIHPDVIIYLRPQYPDKLWGKNKDNLEVNIDYVKGQEIFDELFKTKQFSTVTVPALEWNTNDLAMQALQTILGVFV